MLKTIPWICFFCLCAHGLERPTPDTLQKHLRSSQSLMSPAFKSEVQKRIEHMDQQLYIITLSRGILVTEIPEIASWVDLQTKNWPILTPGFERALMAALSLETQMLDRLLEKKNPPLAQSLKKSRTMIRLMKEDERFFKDGRDHFVCCFFRALDQMDDILNGLDCPGNKAWQYPGEAKTVRDIENALLEKMDFTLHKIQDLPDS